MPRQAVYELDDTDADAYPLAWPVGWPRKHPSERKAARFSQYGEGSIHAGRREVTITEGRNRLIDELARLKATSVVISTDIPTNRNGTLRAVRAETISDPGAAVYFRLRGEPRVLACDRWDRLADNLTAIAKHISAIRGIERWGVGTLEQVFSAYRALPAVGSRQLWYQVLGFKTPPTAGEAEAKYLELMRLHHPDRGGNANQAAEISAAWTEGRKAMGL